MGNGNLTRRAFLAATTLAATGLAFPVRANTARVVPGKLSPNEKMNVAAIGAGGKGLGDIMACSKENVVGLADPDWVTCAEAFARLPEAKRYKDFRKMLEEMPEIDAVTISTPDHTHAPAAFMAMNLGKHVYVQKPLTHTVAEARLLTNLARETGVITQMGNQGRSGDGARELCEMIWDGAAGGIHTVYTWSNRPIWPQGMDAQLEEQAVPETMDWDLWLGPAPYRPYNAEYAPFKWRGWWDFGCGALGDMACHIMDPVFWALKLGDASHFTVELVAQSKTTEESAPTASIVKYSFPARGDMPPVDVLWYDGDLRPPRPEGVEADERLGDGNNGSTFIGENAVLTSGTYGGDSRIVSKEQMGDYTRPEPSIERVPGENHYQDWIDACKNNRPACSNFDISGPFTEMVNFGNIAIRTGKKLSYDMVEGKVTNDPSANQYLTKEYREGWELPC